MRLLNGILIAVIGLFFSCVQIPAQMDVTEVGLKVREGAGKTPEAVAFINVNVVPMTAEIVLRDQTVVIRGGRIVEIGKSERIRLPKDAMVIDGRGKYLMPGLVDSHVHLEYFDRDEQLFLFIAAGVTTVRNMDGRPNILEWRKRAADRSLPAPHIFTAGAILEGNPPFRKDNKVVATADEATAEVKAQKLAGYDFIKIYHTLDAQTYAAIIGAAKKHGLPIVGHVPRSVGLRATIAAGQKAIEHLDGFIEEIEADDSPLRHQRSWRKRYFAVKVDGKKIKEIVSAMKRAKVWNVPTLVERQRSALTEETARNLLRRPEMKSPTGNGRVLEQYESADYRKNVGGRFRARI